MSPQRKRTRVSGYEQTRNGKTIQVSAHIAGRPSGGLTKLAATAAGALLGVLGSLALGASQTLAVTAMLVVGVTAYALASLILAAQMDKGRGARKPQHGFMRRAWKRHRATRARARGQRARSCNRCGARATAQLNDESLCGSCRRQALVAAGTVVDSGDWLRRQRAARAGELRVMRTWEAEHAERAHTRSKAQLRRRRQREAEERGAFEREAKATEKQLREQTAAA